MRLFLLLASAIGAVAAVYFFVLQPSPADRLSRSLTEVAGDYNSTVALNGCNLSLLIEIGGQEGTPIALTRTSIQADLRNYNFATVRIIPNATGAHLHIGRGPVDEHMLIQVSNIIEAGGDRTRQLLSNENAAKELLETEDGSLFFRVMAEVVTTEGGTQELIAHEDAPDFYRFIQAVESTPRPVSYRTTTTFTSAEVSAETFLTGEVIAIPFLQFSMDSEDKVKALAHAFREYAVANGCE